MIDLNPDLALEGLSLMEKAQAIYQEPIVWIPFSAILGLMFLFFLLIGVSIKVSHRKRLISQGNFWYIIAVWLFCTGLFILTLFFPFWWLIFK